MIELSIIIPIYNVEEYIEKCIASVYQQQLDKGQFELIIVDDESPDTSLQLVENIAKEHNNIRIISQKNQGLGGARNTGLEAAKGQFIFFLDSDDYLNENVLAPLLDLAKKNTVDFIEFGTQMVYPDGKIGTVFSKTSEGKIYSGISYGINFEYMYCAHNKLYSLDFLRNNDLLFVKHIYIEDYEFMTRALIKAKRILAIDLVVTNFYQSPNSITRGGNASKKQKMVDDLRKILSIVGEAKKQAIADNAPSETSTFYDVRLSFLNVTIMTQLVKNKVSFAKFEEMRKSLREEGVWVLNQPVVETGRNLFRLALKNCFGAFAVVLSLYAKISK